MSLYRIGTANAYDRTVHNINRRQSEIAQSQEQLSSGKRVLRASDDAVAATLAERAQNRLARTEADLVALDSSRSALVQAESGLGEASDLLHRVRELVVQAGDPVLAPNSREDLAKQIEGLREQMLAVANRQDANGFTLYGGLGGAAKPFVDLYGPQAGVRFDGQDGQYAATEDSLPHNINGKTVWMRVPEGNGVMVTSLGSANTGTAGGSVVVNTPVGFPSPAPTYRVDFVDDPTSTNVPPDKLVSIYDQASGMLVSPAQPYVDGMVVPIAPGAGDIDVTLTGAPDAGDSLYLRPGLPPALPENYTVEADTGNTGSVWSDQTELSGNPLTGDRYRVEFLLNGTTMQFRVLNLSTGGEVVPPTDYVDGKAVDLENGAISLQMRGQPVAGDSIEVQPSVNSDLFKTMQNIIDALRYDGDNQQGELPHQISRGLKELDTGLDRILDARGRVGEWLNRADSMETLFNDKAVFYQKEQSTQEDLDMVKGISEFQSRQTALQAALQSYAQVQKLSLFQYIA
ncbi:MAG: flagellar hook-associated protein FlgL [Hydrogenophaga sp.]|nr:flagellar hook-associated protein FlgL [Hydrogenophaga sp.]